MTNFDKAAELILPYIGGCTECDRIGDACLDCTREAKDAVKDIAEAGLLAPDLPEANATDIFVPDGKGWLPCGLTGPSVWTAPGGRIMVQRVEPGDLTPGEAQWLLDKCHQPDVDLPDIMYGEYIADMAETIADMHYEYAVQVHLEENGQWHQVTEWSADPNPYKPGHAPKHNERIVRRLVSQPEVMEP